MAGFTQYEHLANRPLNWYDSVILLNKRTLFKLSIAMSCFVLSYNTEEGANPREGVLTYYLAYVKNCMEMKQILEEDDEIDFENMITIFIT